MRHLNFTDQTGMMTYYTPTVCRAFDQSHYWFKESLLTGVTLKLALPWDFLLLFIGYCVFVLNRSERSCVLSGQHAEKSVNIFY